MPLTELRWGRKPWGALCFSGCTCRSSLSPLSHELASPPVNISPWMILNHIWGHFGSNHSSNRKGPRPPHPGLAVPLVLLKVIWLRALAPSAETQTHSCSSRGSRRPLQLSASSLPSPIKTQRNQMQCLSKNFLSWTPQDWRFLKNQLNAELNRTSHI